MHDHDQLSPAGECLFGKVQALMPQVLTRASSTMAEAVEKVRAAIKDLGPAIPEKLRESWLKAVFDPVSGLEVDPQHYAFLPVDCFCFTVGDDPDCGCLPSESSLPQLANALADMYKVGVEGRPTAITLSVNFLKIYSYGNSGVDTNALVSFIGTLLNAKGENRKKKIEIFKVSARAE